MFNKSSIKTIFVIAMMLVTVLILSVTFMLTMFLFEQEITHYEEEIVHLKSNQFTKMITSEMDSVLQDAQLLSENTFLVNASLSQGDSREQSLSKIVNEVMKRNGIMAVKVTDYRGRDIYQATKHDLIESMKSVADKERAADNSSVFIPVAKGSVLSINFPILYYGATQGTVSVWFDFESLCNEIVINAGLHKDAFNTQVLYEDQVVFNSGIQYENPSLSYESKIISVDHLLDLDLKLSVRPDFIEPYLYEARLDLLYIGMSVLCFALITSYLVAVRITAPIITLSRRVRENKLGHQVTCYPVNGSHEIEQLAQTFDAFSSNIHQSHDRLEWLVEDRTKKLLESNTQLKQFSYIAAHDMQEPIRQATSFLVLAQQDYGSASSQEMLVLATETLERMRGLVQRILEFAKVANTELDKQMIEVGYVLNSVNTDFTTLYKEQGVKFCLEATNEQIYVDKSLIHLVISNIIKNAIKFNENKNKIISVTAENISDAYLQINISDNGIGIPDDKKEAIFDFFERLHTFEEYPGYGIGLSLCRRIVESHNGVIWITDSEYGGSCFHVRLPLTAEGYTLHEYFDD